MSLYNFNANLLKRLSIFLLIEMWLNVSVMIFLSSKYIKINVLLICVFKIKISINKTFNRLINKTFNRFFYLKKPSTNNTKKLLAMLKKTSNQNTSANPNILVQIFFPNTLMLFKSYIRSEILCVKFISIENTGLASGSYFIYVAL